jgi:Kef-type K+ transport system membrane component KefB
MWSTDGCVLVKQESNRYVTVCECNHLTNFAALMDYTERNDTLKSLLTHICCGLSVLFLIFTIIVLLLPNERNKLASIEKLKDKSNLIIFNLCICLIVANLLVIFGMDNIEFEPQV